MTVFLMADDIYEDAEIRRGKLCWHKLDGMARIAANDLVMLQVGCDRILNRFFGHLPCYSGMMHVVTESFMIALLGHTWEIKLNEMDLQHYTLKLFDESALLKTSTFRIYMPAAMSMLLAG